MASRQRRLCAWVLGTDRKKMARPTLHGWQQAVTHGCEAPVSVAVTKYLTKSSWKQRGSIWAHCLRVQPVTAGKPCGRQKGTPLALGRQRQEVQQLVGCYFELYETLSPKMCVKLVLYVSSFRYFMKVKDGKMFYIPL